MTTTFPDKIVRTGPSTEEQLRDAEHEIEQLRKSLEHTNELLLQQNLKIADLERTNKKFGPKPGSETPAEVKTITVEKKIVIYQEKEVFVEKPAPLLCENCRHRLAEQTCVRCGAELCSLCHDGSAGSPRMILPHICRK